jgi:8-oxo-dGTP pyrophosphatase MutT (NUDIX family)
VRALILTPAGEILLMRAREPLSGRQVWFAPGGGLEPGESPTVCLQRELLEETGKRDLQIGPPVWTRSHTFDWNGRWISQHETFYLVRSLHFSPTNQHNPDPVEGAAFMEFRWWTAEQIAASGDLFAPRRLADWLAELAEHGPPAEPIDVGV